MTIEVDRIVQTSCCLRRRPKSRTILSAFAIPGGTIDICVSYRCADNADCAEREIKEVNEVLARYAALVRWS